MYQQPSLNDPSESNIPDYYEDEPRNEQPSRNDPSESHNPDYYENEPQNEPPRKFRYSTAQMNETPKWRKWCQILAIFLFFLLFMIGLSMLFQHIFFGDQSDNGPGDIEDRTSNSTFPLDKQEIDSACGRQTFLADQGELCKEHCVPQFFKCCDPFDEFNLYNYTKVADDNTTDLNGGNTTDLIGGNSTRKPGRTSFEPLEEKNTTFLVGHEDYDDSMCSFDKDLRGCMSYAKCQALGGQADPAPASLPDMCTFDRLQRDPESCQELCQKLECCYSDGSDNCMAEKFDLCMDYAPCQNLRSLTVDPDTILPTAPRTLDFDCYWQQPACQDACELAACCGDLANSCFQYNFMSCLTYAPCNNVTTTTISIPPQFSAIPKPPVDIIYACNADNEPILEPTDKTCEEMCTDAACCFSNDPELNCFSKDPLGCLAWDAQCKVLKK